MNKEVFFADEAIFHLRQVKDRAWSQQRQNIAPLKSLKFEPVIACVGAVSKKNGEVTYAIKPKSITGADFVEFLQ